MSDALSILKRYGIRPSKGLGQNFLVDAGHMARIVATAGLSRGDTVLEVGPGVGLLTRRLAEQAGRVVAVELDHRMVAILDETLADLPNVEIVSGDILEVDPRQLLSSGEQLPAYRVVANLPYYITSAVLRHLLEASAPPVALTVMVQYEVAQRIVAAPGDLSLLAISVQVFGQPRLAFRVPAGAFYPQPKVDSAVLQIELYPEPRVPRNELARFFRVVHAGFGQKRKQVRNSLAANLALTREDVTAALAAAAVSPDRRPQTLTIDEWLALSRALPL